MFSEVVQDHFYNPRNTGPLENATHQAVIGMPGDGPYMELWFQVETATIRRATYRTYGCPAAVASASLIAELSTGRSISTLLSITCADILKLLGDLPPNKIECAQMAVDAVHRAFRPPSQ